MHHSGIAELELHRRKVLLRIQSLCWEVYWLAQLEQVLLMCQRSIDGYKLGRWFPDGRMQWPRFVVDLLWVSVVNKLYILLYLFKNNRCKIEISCEVLIFFRR